jgi:very-short-patch-repair endonuclease
MNRAIRLPYTREEMENEALKYKTRNEFCVKSRGQYNAARRRKILDQICKHMPIVSNDSILEKELFSILKDPYPSATKLRDYKVSIPKKPWIKGFEIDVYIPELKRGIEFDGTYHHSINGLRRSHKKWPEDQLKNYHKIKDSYFKTKGIDILHIKEEDWLKNRKRCIKKILFFLRK